MSTSNPQARRRNGKEATREYLNGDINLEEYEKALGVPERRELASESVNDVEDDEPVNAVEDDEPEE